MPVSRQRPPGRMDRNEACRSGCSGTKRFIPFRSIELETELRSCRKPPERRPGPLRLPLSVDLGSGRRGELPDRYPLMSHLRAKRQSPQTDLSGDLEQVVTEAGLTAK